MRVVVVVFLGDDSAASTTDMDASFLILLELICWKVVGMSYLLSKQRFYVVELYFIFAGGGFALELFDYFFRRVVVLVLYLATLLVEFVFLSAVVVDDCMVVTLKDFLEDLCCRLA